MFTKRESYINFSHCIPHPKPDISRCNQHIEYTTGNLGITELSNMFPLWLDNFGSGKVNLKAFHDCLLSYVKIDPKLVWDILSRPAPDLIMDPLLNVMKSQQQGLGVIVKGIDTLEHLKKVHHLKVDAIQGKLWPAIPLDALEQELTPAA